MKSISTRLAAGKKLRARVRVTVEDGRVLECPMQLRVGALLDKAVDAHGLHYVGALVNHEVVSLSYPVDITCSLRFLTLADPHGWHVYRRSVCFLLAKAVRDCFPEARFAVENSLGTGFFCSFRIQHRKGITDRQLATLRDHMRALVAAARPITRRKLSYAEAVAQFEQEGQTDKLNLLRYRNIPKIVIFDCDGFSDLAHEPLAENTRALQHFALVAYQSGFVVQFPERGPDPVIPPFEEQPHLYRIFQEHKRWGRILGVRTVGDLNDIIRRRDIADFMRITEACHEKKIAHIADDIAERARRVRWICIAGPSSSGKTTFAKRLAVQLRVNGLRPVMLSTDDYFVEREHTPRDESGQPDFENLETIDLKLLHEHFARLEQGEEVEIPSFNFALGRREFRGRMLRLAEDEMIIVEGIHALNPRLTENIPAAHKFRIYISALTQLNLDFHNRISTTDNRLLRRMVRDHAFRGNSPLTTLQMWPGVRRGEKKWIFPFQREADAAFNSALDYELAVLKPIAEPLLAEIKPMQEQYAEARRLANFLASFVAVPAALVPGNSLLREFIGDSAFRY